MREPFGSSFKFFMVAIPKSIFFSPHHRTARSEDSSLLPRNWPEGEENGRVLGGARRREWARPLESNQVRSMAVRRREALRGPCELSLLLLPFLLIYPPPVPFSFLAYPQLTHSGQPVSVSALSLPLFSNELLCCRTLGYGRACTPQLPSS